MSTLRLGLVLRNLAFVCVAGAVGFDLGKAEVSAHATPPGDFEVVPKYPWADGTGHATWYAPVVAHHDHMGELPTAGYEWRHVGAHTGPLSDYELFAPRYTAPAATKCERWYPSVVLNQDHAALFPAMGYASIPESKPWVMIESSGSSANYGGGMWVLLPDPRVFVLDNPTVVRNQDHASPFPTTGYAWTSEGKPWEALEPAGSGAKLYSGQSLWMTDPRVLVLDTASPGSTEPSPPSPVTRR